jgi:cellulose synthase (UDP-forming)
VKRSRLWRELESGDTRPLRSLRFLILAGGVLFLCWTAALSLSWEEQLVLALLTVGAAIWIDRSSKSDLVTLTLVLLSVYSTLRYGLWRFSSVVGYFREPGTSWTGIDAFFIWMLLLAECYAFMVLVLGYVQTLWPLGRAPVSLPSDPEEWPAVDLLIPTYNEPLSLVRFTALAALNIDWPADKLNVYILDDGKREEFRAFAEEAGVGYIARDDNEHAKAGNINHALKQLSSPFVAVFDCDHVPTRSFLQLTMGWFLRDHKLAMLQTPQHFYSPDPFERNLDQFRVMPSEDELFYGVVQDGNDFWNATFFCGSCAVLRRSALDEIGGVAVETVTEDAHTSLRMQMRGWNTAYINISQAAGLANERLSGHIRQRVRWARGMVQILRIENPLFAPGLKPAQRLCYFNAMSHFLYALPRLIFLTAPAIYLIFGIRNIPGSWMAIVAYALPYLALSSVTNSRIQGRHRHSFWNEIYETVMAPYILLPTLLALIRPKAGKFNVTAKGGVVNKNYFDARIAWPYLMLAAINLASLFCAAARLIQLPVLAVPGWLPFVNWPASIYDAGHAGTVWVNVLWTLFNLAILGVATAVARESQQRRRSTRVALAVPSDVILADGSMIQGMTSDLSSGGVRTRMSQAVKAESGDLIKFVFPVLDGSATLPATIVGTNGGELRAQFDSLSLQEDEALTMILYSRADAWLGLGEGRESDSPVRSLGNILRLSLRGVVKTAGASRSKKSAAKSRLASSAVPIILLALAAGLPGRVARGAQTQTAAARPSASQAMGSSGGSSASTGQFDSSFTLADLGARGAINLRGVEASRSVYFSVPRNQMVKTATIKLRYHFSPGLLPAMSHVNVSLNGTLVATLAANSPPNSTGESLPLAASVALPVELLVHDNQLTFEFIGHYTQQCEDASNSALWAWIDGSSTIELAGTMLPLANDLKVLPLPFLDPGASLHPVVPIVFLSPLSARAIQAAGVIASWIGLLNGSHPVRFTVSVGSIPAGNAILIAPDASQIPAAYGVSGVSGATVAMVTNPSDSHFNLLVVTGMNPDELITAATALVLQAGTWQGPTASIRTLTLPDPRQPDDAPRWLSTESSTGGIGESSDVQGGGSEPAVVYLRLPPDLDFGERKNLAFHLNYRYNGVPLGDDSTLQVYVNGLYVSSTPLPHTENASTVLETVVPIPVVDLRPFSNTITFQFVFHPANHGQCANTPPTNLEGAILKDSHLDISDIPHSTELPNLELFSNAGYPFTRKADLADTAVVLPDQPTAQELEMFLALMGHFGAQTGYPSLRVTVTNAAGMLANGNTDYLVLGTAGDQPALKTLSTLLPVQVDENGLHVHDTQDFMERAAWWRNWDHLPSGQLETESGLPDTLVEGIEWPGRSNRTVVAVVLRDAGAAPGFIAAFLDNSQSSAISQSVSVLRGDQFSAYRLGSDAYRVGVISALERVTAAFEEVPWLIALASTIFCFLMAALIQAMLRRRARLRLQGAEE